MIQLQTIRRVTIYADGTLEETLVDQIMAMGASGYTIVECRGKGQHETMDDRLGLSVPTSRVRIETLVHPDVAEKILRYLHTPDLFQRHAVVGCVETVQILADEPI